MGCCGSSDKRKDGGKNEPLLDNKGGGGGGRRAGRAMVHAKLPAGAEKRWCHHVYDGDTLTLDEGKGERVRFLGIDTPEIAEQQAFATEARDFTRAYCDKQDIWLVFHTERADRYGRLLAFVWAEAKPDVDGGSGYVCVNEGIVAAGSAGFYHPGNQAKLPNEAYLLELQQQAADAKRGKWVAFEDRTVAKTKNGKAYHVESCKCAHLKRGWHMEHLKESQAMSMGLSACRDCLS